MVTPQRPLSMFTTFQGLWIRIFARSKRTENPTILQVHYQNVRGLQTKLRSLMGTAINNCNAFCITVSWLHPDIKDGEITDKSFTIFRRDKDYISCGGDRSGGVFIAIKRSILVERIPISEKGIEQIYVKIKCNNSDFMLSCVYLPPRSCYNTYLSLLNTLSYLKEKFHDAKLLITGIYYTRVSQHLSANSIIVY